MQTVPSRTLRQRLRRYVGNKAFYRMALAVAVPIMIQNGITQFVSLLDNIMVGSVGTLPMAGVGIANQLMFVFNLAIFGSVSGAGIFGAQFFGKGDHQGVQYAFRFKLIIGMLLTLSGLALFLFLDEPLISLYLQGEGTAADRAETLVYAKEYLHIMLLSFVPFVLTQCYAGTLRETGQTMVPMVAGIASVLVNLCFNTLLIYGFLGFPAMGIRGAAIATVIARFVEAAIVMVWTHRHTAENPFIRGAWRSLRIPAHLALDIFRKTLPLMLNETLWSCGVALLSMCYSLHGLDVVPAHTMASTISNVFNVAFLAMGNAVGIIVGQLLGAGRLEEAVDTDRKLIAFSVGTCLFTGGAMALLSPYIPLLYNATPAVRTLASRFLLISALCMPLNSLTNACYFTLRSGGKTLVTFVFDSCYICLITVPLAFALTTWTNITIVPLFLICQLIDIGKCVVGLVMIKKGVWIHNIVDGKAAA